MYDLKDKVVVVTGASNGIGANFVREILEEGVKTALINGTLKAIELMRKDKGGRGGTIINVSSIGGLIQVSPMFTYSTSKRAVLQFTTCVGRFPCENTDVRVMAVCVGVTETAILQKLTCFTKEMNVEAEKILSGHPMQSAKSVARGMVEMYQKGGPASIWLVRADRPAQEITAELNKADEEMEAIIRKID